MNKSRRHVRFGYILALALTLLAAAAIWNYGAIKSAFIVHRVHEMLEPELAAKKLSWGSPVYIRIYKEEKALELWIQDGEQFQLFATYPVCDYSGQLGPKVAEGDRQSPEGFYRVSKESMNPRSSYHLAFNLGFPNEYDSANGRRGSFLMVHGNCVSIGCYAITDENIEKVYALMQAALDGGQSAVDVHVFPFHMTQENLELHKDSKWLDFWNDLKPAQDWFDKNKRVPVITVRDKRYHLVQ